MKIRNFRFSALVVLFFLWTHQMASAQPNADFSTDASACLQQNIRLQNLSSGAATYEWDFCADDALTVKSVDVAALLSSMQGGYGFKLAEDNGSWIGFAISQSNNTLLRLDFGSTPLGTPVVTNLGNLNGVLQMPQGIDIIKQGNNWFGFVGFSNTDVGFVRLDFGSTLSNTPAATNVGMFGLTGRMWDVKLVENSSGYYLLTVNRDNNTLSRISFGNSFLNSVSAAGVFQSAAIPGASLLLGLDVIQVGSVYKAMLADYSSNSIIQLDLGSSLSSASFTSEGNYTFPAFSNPFRVRLVREGLSFRALVANNGAIVTVIDLKDMVQVPQVIAQPSVPIMIGIDAFRWNGKTILCGVSFYDQKVNRVVFEQDCHANSMFANTAIPPNLFYTQAGNKIIELKATDNAGVSSYKTLVTSISALSSPDISFTYVNSCAQSPINFTSQNSSGGIATYDWKFGDSVSDTPANPSHSYSAGGNYVVDLIVTGANSCKNFSNQTISVFNSPVANFQLPAASPVCTNQGYLLSNSSTFDAGSGTQWEWRLNGTLVSSQQDFTVQFNSNAAQQIRLKALLPGCENELIKDIAAVVTGPAVNFTANDGCQGSAISFNNSTTGADAGYVWNFGDGGTSTVPNATHAYASAVVFQATLTASNSAGCQNFLTKPIRIYSKPVPDFSVGLPPFSCSGTSTPIQNNTPALTDSNIASWNWQFGDTSNPTSTQQNPSHTYSNSGIYTVGLTALSDRGCSSTFSKMITIAASPVADFTMSTACINQSTKFTDASNGNVQSHIWQIASTGFTIPNPSYTFTFAGSFNATLTVTGANACSSFKTKQIVVLPTPSLDFTATNLCANNNTFFTDITASPQDPITAWSWNFAGNTANGNPAQFVFNTSGSNNVKMTTVHTSGCQYMVSKSLMINASPAASFTATPDRGSAPLVVQFINTSLQANSYSWKFYDKVTATSTQISPAYAFTSLGDYSAELTATNGIGCSSVMTVPIKVLVPTIDLIMSDFFLTSDPLTGKLKGMVSILNNSNVPITTTEVDLIMSSKTVLNETVTINLSPGQSTTKTLSFTISPNQSNFLCAEIISDKDVQKDNNKRCIDLDKSDYFFDPYPNPTAGNVKVDWISVTSGSARIVIYDGLGKKSFEWETMSKAGLNQSVLDVTFLTAGLYYLTIETAAAKKTTRFFRI